MEKNIPTIPLIDNFPTIILANGAFPTAKEPLSQLNNAQQIIACDGAAEKLIAYGKSPDYIIGDLDSLPLSLRKTYANKTIQIKEQESNDLSKAVHFCISQGWTNITILGATGLREDHTLGNIFLLEEYLPFGNVQMISDYGVFRAIKEPTCFQSYIGQQVSLFCIHAQGNVLCKGLKYLPQDNYLKALWAGTLNEAISDTFEVDFSPSIGIVYRAFDKKL